MEIARVRSAAKALFVLFGIRLALVAVGFVAFRILGAVTTDIQVFQIAGYALDGLEGSSAFIGLIVFLVWLARAHRAIAAVGGQTSMSAGLAVWGWFIPIANVVLPWLGLRSAWRGARSDSSAIVGVWWLAYLLMTAHNVVTAVFMQAGAVIPEGTAGLFNAMGYAGLPLVLATYGLWLLIVSKVTGAIAGTSQSPAAAHLAGAGA